MTEYLTAAAIVVAILVAAIVVAIVMEGLLIVDDEPDPTESELYERMRAQWFHDPDDPVWPAHRAPPEDEDETGPEWGGNPPDDTA